MSLITRCPSCHTMFRVVQDQLRVSDGWVRCGQCSEIFDAATALVDAGALANAAGPAVSQPTPSELHSGAATTAPPDMPMVAAAAAEGQITDAAQQPDTMGPASLAHESVDHVEIPLGDPADLPGQQAPISLEFGAMDARPEAVTKDAGAVASGEPGPDGGATPVQSHDPAAQLADAHRAGHPVPTNHPSFLREMPKRSPWHRIWVRVLLSAAALTLITALAGQVAVQERDRLSAMFPQIRPALSWLCEQAGCVVGALRRIDSVVIEGSSFNKTRGDNYRLSLVLKNTSALDIALPALELTLTDSQDQAVMRRVLLPSDLGASNALLKGGGEWSGNINVAVRLSGSAERFSGYRVLAFYP